MSKTIECHLKCHSGSFTATNVCVAFEEAASSYIHMTMQESASSQPCFWAAA